MTTVKIKTAEEIGEILGRYLESRLSYPHQASDRLGSGRGTPLESESRTMLEIAADRLIEGLMSVGGREMSETALVSIVRDKLLGSKEPAIQDLPPVHIAELLMTEQQTP